MPFIYQTTFDIPNEALDQLQIGRSLQLSLSYLKAFIANEPGFISTRAMYSLMHDSVIHVIYESSWEDWASFQNHREKSPFAEKKMLDRFELKVQPQNLTTHIYEEVA